MEGTLDSHRDDKTNQSQELDKNKMGLNRDSSCEDVIKAANEEDSGQKDSI